MKNGFINGLINGLIDGLLNALISRKAVLALLLASASTVALAQGDVIKVIAAAANHAEQQCNALAHDDTDEYESCTDALFAAVKGKGAVATQQRLGIVYFGWVGAMRWVRVGLPGAEQAAKRYFLQLRPLQQQLKLGDEALCPALAGDCKARVAQMAEAKRDYAVDAPAKKARPVKGG